jgi:hypothetical protein
MQGWPYRLIAGSLIVLAAAPATADVLSEFVQPVPGSCWERTYTDDHLARHPRQKVTEMRFLLQNWRGEYGFDMDIATRERAGTITGSCSAEPDGSALCAVSCDDGVILLKKSGDDGLILVEIGEAGRLLVNARCEASEGASPFEIEAEPDDTSFLLRPTSVQTCTVQPFKPFLDHRGD